MGNMDYLYKESLNKRRHIVCTMAVIVFFIILLFVLLSLVWTTHAANSMLQDAFDGTDFIGALNKIFAKNSRFYRFTQRIDTGTFYKNIKQIALFICAFAFMVNTADELTRAGWTPTIFIKGIVLYVIVSGAITHAADLASALDGVGNDMVDICRNWAGQASASITVSDWSDIWDSQSGAGIAKWFGGFAVQIFFVIGMIFIKIRIYQQGFARLIELCVLKLFLPAGIAWIPLNGIRGGGLAYMKLYVGVYMRIGIFYIIAIFAAKFMTVSASANIASLETLYIIFSLCLLVPSMMSSSDAIVSRIAGI